MFLVTSIGRRAAVLLAAGAIAAGPSAAGPLFRAPFYPFEAGNQPSVVVAADFDGDAKLDLAAANYTLGNNFLSSISVLMAQGQGAFAPRVPYGTRAQLGSMVTAYWNRDGHPDLAAVSYASSAVSVLLGVGDGTFAADVDYGGGPGAIALAAGDFNGDTKPDVVVANSGGAGSVSILIGNGDGSFQNRVDYAAGLGAQAVATGDLNGDGKLDVVTANGVAGSSANTITVLIGAGNGTFGAPQSYAVPGNPVQVAILDFNADGKADVAVSSVFTALPGQIALFRGLGNGGLGMRTDVATPEGSGAVGFGDLDLDGKPDAVASGIGFVSVMKGTGLGFLAGVAFATGADPSWVTVADVTADGKPDVLVAEKAGGAGPETGALVLLPGNGDGTLGSGVPVATGSRPVGLAVGDLDGDQKPDVATANNFGNSVSVLHGNGDGTLGTRFDLAVGAYPVGVAIGEFNQDGAADLAVANDTGFDALTVWLGTGGGGFAGRHDYEVGSYARSVAAADVNGDGALDLLLARDFASRVALCLGSGGGTFGAASQIPTGGVIRAFAADLSGDGRRELLGAGAGISVALGNGDGTFAPYAAVGSDATYALAAGDLNGDGKLDLVSGGAALWVRRGNGDGTFGAAATYETHGNPYAVAIGDLNGDGKPDVAAANSAANDVTVFLGNGDGTLGARSDYGCGGTPLALAIADLDQDGKPELVVANSYPASTVIVLRNVSTPPLSIELTRSPGGALGLRPLWPSSEGLRVSFRLQGSAPATLSAFDLAGRLIARERVTAGGGGWRTLNLGAPPSGVYLVRLQQGAEQIVARAVSLR